MSVSIKDMTTAFGLSKATVSWILSRQGEAKGFSAMTIKRVKEYAESINYRPNLVARSLSLGDSNTLGLIIPFLRDTYYARLAYYIERYATLKGYSLIVCSLEGNSAKEPDLIFTLMARCVDRIIMAPTKTDMKGIKYLIKQNFPFVLIDRYTQNINTNYGIVNNCKSSYDIVHFLAENGAKKIAIVVTDVHLYIMKQRLDGYRRALRDAGLADGLALEEFIDRQTYESDIIEKLNCLFIEMPDVDGFFFATHYLAMSTIRNFVNNNIDYHRYAMGCFDVMDGLDLLAPKMCLALFPIEDMTKEAVDILLDNMQSEELYQYQNRVFRLYVCTVNKGIIFLPFLFNRLKSLC